MPVANTIIREDLEAIIASGIDWQRFNGKTVLVSGANGFLPAYMVETLLFLKEIYAGFAIKVLALVRNGEKARARFSAYSTDSQLVFIEQDVTEELTIKEKIHFIIHAASQASPKYFGSDPVGTLRANVTGTLNLMELARQHAVESFLYLSSGEVYGEVSNDQVPIKEDTFGYIDPTHLRSCYAESKRMGENICVSYFHQYQVPAKIVRPFHTYGPGMLLNDGRVYADFVADILHGQNIVMQSDGSAIRAFCYLADATRGFFKVLLEGENAEAYNVGNPDAEYSIIALAELLVTLFPEKKLQVQTQAMNKENGYLNSALTRNSPDISKMQQLNWTPVVNAAEGFKRTIQSYPGK